MGDDKNQDDAAVDKGDKKDEAKEPPPDRTRTTRHTATIAGQAIDYTATAGVYTMRDPDKKPKATMSFVAYVRDDVEDRVERPVSFVFNGGPGSSSVWLHLGMCGPRRIPVDDSAPPPVPPYRLVDNEYSLLDLTDLVFIDPVSTGYGRPLVGEEKKQFHGVTEDTEWVGEFIRLWATRAGRWGSPKYLIGESYGTTRAASLANHLQNKMGMTLNGIVFVSSALLFQTLSFDPANDIGFVMVLPSYAATAWYHGRLAADVAPDLESLVAEVESFALGPYATLLLHGGRATPEERERVIDGLVRYTGLDRQFLEQSNLRVPVQRFTKELLRSERRTIGRLDSRFAGIDRDAAGETAEYDPLLAMILGPYTGALHDYLHHELRFETDDAYEIMSGEKVQPWRMPENKYVSMAEPLRAAMSRNPGLRVFLASGYYDLGTPHLAAEWTFDHIGLEPELTANITTRRYEAGHMMYIHEPSFAALRADLAEWFTAAT